MKALVTGGSGFIGSTLIDALTKRGVSVSVLMRKTSLDRNLRGLIYERVEGDISDFESLRQAVKGVDTVFHLAGVISARDRAEYFRANAEGTSHLARAAAEAGVERFIYVSSLAAGGPAVSSPRVETDTDRPVSIYGESKKAGEDELLRYRGSFLPLILRPPLVYGPKDQATLLLVKTVAKRFVPKFSAATPDGEKHYSVIHSRDLVDAIVALGTTPKGNFENGDIFYISSGEDIPSSRLMGSMALALGVKTWTLPIPMGFVGMVAGALTLLGRLLGRSFVLNRDKLNEIRPDYWTCGHEKLTNKTSWRPKILFEDGIRDAVNWYRANGWIG